MAAFNWICVMARCPTCGSVAQLRCQTHVASAYEGVSGRRFHDRDYEIGQPMAWWPRDDKRFPQWRANRWRGQPATEIDEEACYASCMSCEASLYVVVRFHENLPERVIAIGKEDDWPSEYLR